MFLVFKMVLYAIYALSIISSLALQSISPHRSAMQLMLPFVTNSLAVRTTPRPDKHYVIMDSDWFTAEFMPCLIVIALVGDVRYY
ncbi:hypothetical protein ACN38_g1336 [Penicillium nordicum]|uniref:Uncharacterized protein n=1 Tax=Penicillium nordicum TaxID=229535 RepID=A0A0M8P8T9_9EURO|nr:hypothetical protein ACN38_g1336 [Penicillium nordicum]